MQLHSNDAFRWSCCVKTVTREYASLIPRFRTFLAEFATACVISRTTCTLCVRAHCDAVHEKTHAQRYCNCVRNSRELISLPVSSLTNQNVRYRGTQWHHSAGIARWRDELIANWRRSNRNLTRISKCRQLFTTSNNFFRKRTNEAKTMKNH